MDGIIEAAKQTNSPLVIILSTIIVILATAFGTFLVTHFKSNDKETERLHSLIKLKDQQIVDINKEKDEIVEARNEQLVEISEKAFTVISNNNISNIRNRDAIKALIDKIKSL